MKIIAGGEEKIENLEIMAMSGEKNVRNQRKIEAT